MPKSNPKKDVEFHPDAWPECRRSATKRLIERRGLPAALFAEQSERFGIIAPLVTIAAVIVLLACRDARSDGGRILRTFTATWASPLR
jgi:hypothetical protein